ncbi:MAG: SMC-Scp complex subunit ScpB [Armatimonadota bacterium]|nr:SMC-Scp complex subunit ScpB [Armatimonadota bacterium]
MSEQKDNTVNKNDVVEIVAVQPLSEAPVSEIAEVVPGSVVAEARQPDADLHLQRAIECMLFVSTEPLNVNQLADALQVEPEKVEDALSALERRLDATSGLQLMRIAGGYQLCTRPEYADYCSAILQPARKKLSKAALETLAIIAYRQPCTQPEIEAVRGVSVDGVIKTLLDRCLIKEAGRKQAPGRPILYATTPEFLQYFGLNDLSELPDIDAFANDESKALQAKREALQQAERRRQEGGAQDCGEDASLDCDEEPKT